MYHALALLLVAWVVTPLAGAARPRGRMAVRRRNGALLRLPVRARADRRARVRRGDPRRRGVLACRVGESGAGDMADLTPTLFPYLDRHDIRRFDPLDPRSAGTPVGRPAPPHGITHPSARHAARAGGRPAGVATLPTRLGAAATDAAVSGRPVGGPDAGVQRGPGVLVARLRHHILRAAAHDLRLLRSRAGPRRGAARARR